MLIRLDVEQLKMSMSNENGNGARKPLNCQNGHGSHKSFIEAAPESSLVRPLHPTWRAFVSYCEELKHGEIELLKIQDGLPVLAEVTKKKVKFGGYRVQ